MSANPNPQVVLVTTQGTIKFELYPDKAPARLGGRARAS